MPHSASYGNSHLDHTAKVDLKGTGLHGKQNKKRKQELEAKDRGAERKCKRTKDRLHPTAQQFRELEGIAITAFWMD